jgi:hypothetical protein
MRLAIATAVWTVGLLLAPAHAANWLPIDPADLALKTPRIDKDADAEVMFWDIRVDDNPLGTYGTAWTQYIRIKIFTDRGRESQSTVTLTSLPGWITEIAGRTIKPDGTILELKRDAVLDRVAIKTADLKVETRSFTLTGVEAGSIIEYRWRETHYQNYMRLYFQREIPIWEVRYHIKPFPGPWMRFRPFQFQPKPLVRETDGFYVTGASNVPAFHEEPMMPPRNELISWMLVYYTQDRKLEPAKYWQTIAKEFDESLSPLMKPNDAIKQAAQAAIGDASTPDEKLVRLVNYCRTAVKNVGDESSDLTSQQRVSAKENKHPADTLKRGVGTGKDINLLFAALAIAAGFDARVTRLADRSDKFFDQSFLDPYFLRAYNIAVKAGDGWRFFDPASRFVTPGMLRWQEEAAEALLIDPKESRFVETPMSEPEKSLTQRTAKFRLSTDGTLEGDVTVVYTGHPAVEEKNSHAAESPEERAEELIQNLKDRLATAEVTAVKVENLTDPLNPLRYSYHVKVPGYAERAGRRLVLQPAYFHRNAPALFPASARIHPIYFKYPWSEEDEVAIETPAGFALDHAEAPASFRIGQAGEYIVRLTVAADGRTLVYQRNFVMGRKRMIIFPTASYPQLKNVFDSIHQQDDHTILLREEGAK